MHDTCHESVRCPCNIMVITPKDGEADLLHRLAWQSNRVFTSGYVGIEGKVNKENKRGTY